MSTDTKIEWCDHTFNGWWGCSKVHTGCANCYAEDQDKRWTHKGQDPHWGPKATRRFILGSWSLPAKWNAEALERFGRPARVFASSMCDVFEDGGELRGKDYLDLVNQQGQQLAIKDGKVAPCWPKLSDGRDEPGWTYLRLSHLRDMMFERIEQTPNLQWLLLTKRPENILRMVPESWRESWPANVMTGYSASDQVTHDRGVWELLEVPGRHFLSLEPLVGPIELNIPRGCRVCNHPGNIMEVWNEHGRCIRCDGTRQEPTIDWVIAGGESGKPGEPIRPMHPDWVRSLRDQCMYEGVPFHFKQWG